ncbi:MAG: hypothetical protein FJX02_16030 [Alphaproteobacteria bacterium]|nr:hypothetical protein [Alphaproteobacteria bacterium]
MRARSPEFVALLVTMLLLCAAGEVLAQQASRPAREPRREAVTRPAPAAPLSPPVAQRAVAPLPAPAVPALPRPGGAAPAERTIAAVPSVPWLARDPALPPGVARTVETDALLPAAPPDPGPLQRGRAAWDLQGAGVPLTWAQVRDRRQPQPGENRWPMAPAVGVVLNRDGPEIAALPQSRLGFVAGPDFSRDGLPSGVAINARLSVPIGR